MVRRGLQPYGLLFVSFIGVMIALPLIVQAQSNPWSTAVQSNTWFPNRDCAQPLRLKPLGDSITQGVGSDGPGQSGNEQSSLYNHGWRSSLDAALTAQGYQFDFTGQRASGQSSGLTFDYDHDGFPGIKAEVIESGINNTFIFNGAHPPILSTPADVILLHIGTNDLAQNQGVDSTVADVDGILDEIDASHPEIVVIVARIIDQDPEDPNYQPGIVTSFNNALTTMVNDRIAQGDKLIMVNMFNALTYADDMIDRFHPNEAGYDKMDNVWFAPLLAIWPTCLSITSSPVTSAFAGQLYIYDVNVISDPQPATVVYSLQTAPTGMAINSSTGLISWTPAVTQVGTHSVAMKANSSAGSDTQTFNVTVDAYFNYVPVINK